MILNFNVGVTWCSAVEWYISHRTSRSVRFFGALLVLTAVASTNRLSAATPVERSARAERRGSAAEPAQPYTDARVLGAGIMIDFASVTLGGMAYPSGDVMAIGEPVVGYSTNGTYEMLVGPVPALLISAPSTCTPASAPTADPITPNQGFGTKNRYCSFIAGDAGRQQAIQVTFVSLPGFEFAEGRTAWVQRPYVVTEASGSSSGAPEPTYWVAELGCAPHYDDWAQYGVVDLMDDAVLPAAELEIRVIGQDCDTANAGDYSAPLPVTMSQVGDVVGDCGVTPCTPPQGVVDFVDISGVVDKFRNLPSAPRKARSDLINSNVSQPMPDLKVDFVDISYCVDAFRAAAPSIPGPPIDDPCAR